MTALPVSLMTRANLIELHPGSTHTNCSIESIDAADVMWDAILEVMPDALFWQQINTVDVGVHYIAPPAHPNLVKWVFWFVGSPSGTEESTAEYPVIFFVYNMRAVVLGTTLRHRDRGLDNRCICDILVLLDEHGLLPNFPTDWVLE